MESDIKTSSDPNVTCGNPRLLKPKAGSLPPIETTAEESCVHQKSMNQKLNDKTGSKSSERRLSGKEKLLNFSNVFLFLTADVCKVK